MKLRDKSTTILVFLAFTLSFIALWNVSDLITKIENQKQGMSTYRNIRNINIFFGKISELVENGEEEAAKEYSQAVIKHLSDCINTFSECNISVTSTYVTIKHKQSNTKTEVIFKKNEDLPYEIDEIYNENGQILIGESLKEYLSDDEGKRMNLSDEHYSVKGVLKNYGMSRQDERMILLYENLSPGQKNSLIKQIAEDYVRFNYDIGITICLGSSDAVSLENVYQSFSDDLNGIDNTEVIPVPTKEYIGERNYWYQFYHSIFGNISVIFAVVNGIVVSNLWYQRRRREFLIRRIFGYGKGRIWLLMWKEMGKTALGSLLCSTFIWTIYVWIKGSKMEWDFIGLQCLVMACATVLVILVTTICPYIKTMALEPAEGLNKYSAG